MNNLPQLTNELRAFTAFTLWHSSDGWQREIFITREAAEERLVDMCGFGYGLLGWQIVELQCYPSDCNAVRSVDEYKKKYFPNTSESL